MSANIGCYKAFFRSLISRSLQDGHVHYVDIVGKTLFDSSIIKLNTLSKALLNLTLMYQLNCSICSPQTTH
jgi:hypothetical protein